MPTFTQDSVCALGKLSLLECADNQLSSFPPLTYLSSLVRLDLSRNRLCSLPNLPADASPLPLKELLVGWNQITALTSTQAQQTLLALGPALATLDLQTNQITCVCSAVVIFSSLFCFYVRASSPLLSFIGLHSLQ